jgi:hypothetical protein
MGDSFVAHPNALAALDDDAVAGAKARLDHPLTLDLRTEHKVTPLNDMILRNDQGKISGLI